VGNPRLIIWGFLPPAENGLFSGNDPQRTDKTRRVPQQVGRILSQTSCSFCVPYSSRPVFWESNEHIRCPTRTIAEWPALQYIGIVAVVVTVAANVAEPRFSHWSGGGAMATAENTPTSANRTVISDSPNSEKLSRQPVPVTDELSGGEVPVVGIGASAGGLQALKTFLEVVPPDSAMAFVLLQHLDPNHESLMAGLLAKHTAMEVIEAENGTPVEANHVYTTPAGWDITIRADVLHLSEPAESCGARKPVDTFLRSLAEGRREKAIAIILSGTGCDGAEGVRAVRDHGGLNIAQDPKTAPHDGMPRSAMATGAVHYVLPIEQMPEVIARYVENSYLPDARQSDAAVGTNAGSLNEILALLHAEGNCDFRFYKEDMLRRRIERRMGLSRIERISDYQNLLRAQPGELAQLLRDLLIGVTGFFREGEVFSTLQEEAIPRLIEQMISGQPLRVWVPGCATGEEAYSIAMLLHERLARVRRKLRVQVFATDIHQPSLEFARQGTYSREITADVSPERLKRFFTETDAEHHRVRKKLRDSVVFAPHNLISDAPFSNVDLISCRNLLIYLKPEIQKRVLDLFHFALRDGGYLLLGGSENVSRREDCFEPVSKKWRIYHRIGPRRPVGLNIPLVPATAAAAETSAGRKAAAPEPSLADLTRQMVFEHYGPASVLIDRHHKIVQFFGPTNKYLELPADEPTWDLLAMAHEGLRPRLRVALYKAGREGAGVTMENISVRRDGQNRLVKATVKPLTDPESVRGLLLVLFEDIEENSPVVEKRGAEPLEDETLLRQLERELETTKADLQSTIEQLETANEELKASNEEITSMNEELQAGNEELEASKEELQSLNEELRTVNVELQEKMEELAQANNDLANLFASTDIGTLFLDTELRIKRFTPAASRLLSLIPSDVGRHLGDITQKIVGLDLLEDAKVILDKLEPNQTEVQTHAGRWYSMRILPYQTTEDELEGVVATFTDVTDLKAAQLQVQAAKNTLEKCVAERTGMLQVLHDVTSMANEAETTEEALQFVLARIAQHTGWCFGHAYLRPADNPNELVLVDSYYEDVPGRFEQFRTAILYTHLRQGIGLPGLVLKTGQPQWTTDIADDLTARRAEVSESLGIDTVAAFPILVENEVSGVLEFFSDRNIQPDQDIQDSMASVGVQLGRILERKRAQKALKQRELRIRSILDAAPDGVFTADESGRIESFNRAAEQIFQYGAQEAVGQHVRMLVASAPDHEPQMDFDCFLSPTIAGSSRREREVTGRRKDGSTFPMNVSVSEVPLANRRLFTSVVRDVSQRKSLEREVLQISTDEQRRIGQDLHDGIGQELTALNYLATNLQERLQAQEVPGSEKAAELVAGIQRALNQVRVVSKGLVPPELDAHSFIPALGDLRHNMEELHGISCRVENDQSIRLPDRNTVIHLYRIVQEAVNNALKHGQPKNINIEAKTAPNHLRLVVRDDGTGIQSHLDHSGGIGLRTMRYRADLIGATLDVRRADGGGTIVTCTLPQEEHHGQEDG